MCARFTRNIIFVSRRKTTKPCGQFNWAIFDVDFTSSEFMGWRWTFNSWRCWGVWMFLLDVCVCVCVCVCVQICKREWKWSVSETRESLLDFMIVFPPLLNPEHWKRKSRSIFSVMPSDAGWRTVVRVTVMKPNWNATWKWSLGHCLAKPKSQPYSLWSLPFQWVWLSSMLSS